MNESQYNKMSRCERIVYYRTIERMDKELRFVKGGPMSMTSHSIADIRQGIASKICDGRPDRLESIAIANLTYIDRGKFGISFGKKISHRNHRFSISDEIHFEKEKPIPLYPNAIKVIVKINDIWTHVAYVCETDAVTLNCTNNWEDIGIRYEN